MPYRPLHLLAWVNVAAHVAGLALAALAMRPGTPLVSLDERLRYLADSPPGWAAGWAVWMACVVVLVALLAAVAHQLGRPCLASLAVTLAVAGGAVDLVCDLIHIQITPALAAGGERSQFVTWEQLATAGGMVVANGCYTIATLLMTLCLGGRPGVSPWLTAAGWGVFVCGMAMVAAGLFRWPQMVAWSTGPTIGLFCVWGVLAARALEGGGSAT